MIDPQLQSVKANLLADQRQRIVGRGTVTLHPKAVAISGSTATATAGPVTTTATATPTKVVWDMGNGHSVTCDGPGTVYSPSAPNATTNCSYTWGRPGTYQVTATLYWSVTWTATGAPGGGNLGLQAGPAAQVAVTVTESQAINTPTGGGS